MSISTPGLQAGGRIEASRMTLHLVHSAAAGMLSSIPTPTARALGSRNPTGAAARPASPTAQGLRLRPHRPPRYCPSHGRQSTPSESEAVVLPDAVGRFSLVRHGLRVVDEGLRGDKPLVRANTWRSSLVQQPRAPGERTVPESWGSDVEAHVTRFMPARSNRSSREMEEVSRAQALSPRLLQPSPRAQGAYVVASCHRSADTAEALLNCDKMDACGPVVWCRARGWMPYGPR